MKPSTHSTLQELRRKGAEGATTAELMLAGGRNFPARVFELRHEHGHVILEQRIRQGSHLFTLVEEGAGAPATAPLGDAPVSETQAWARERGYTVVRYPAGTYHVCDACSHRWHERGWPTVCPSCKRGSQWIASHWTRGDAERYVPLTTAEATCPAQVRAAA